MKLSCEVVQDLLPLYIDSVCSGDSAELVEEHMVECNVCKQVYDDMKSDGKAEELAQSEDFKNRQTDSVKKVKKKWSRSKKFFLTLGIVIGAGLIFILVKVMMYLGIIGFLMVDFATTKEKVFNDVEKYSEYIGENCHEEYGIDRNGQFEVFPEKITLQMYVRDFQYVYYNPWDPQYVSYLTIDYKDDEAFVKEISRLEELGVENYVGIYSVTGEPQGYDIVAMDKDPYYGFVYAMVPESGETSITYVGIIFCNHFLNLDIHEYMKEEYLLPGFDATMDNPYEQKMMGE